MRKLLNIPMLALAMFTFTTTVNFVRANGVHVTSEGCHLSSTEINRCAERLEECKTGVTVFNEEGRSHIEYRPGLCTDTSDGCKCAVNVKY